jgi:hypothetical protein
VMRKRRGGGVRGPATESGGGLAGGDRI